VPAADPAAARARDRDAGRGAGGVADVVLRGAAVLISCGFRAARSVPQQGGHACPKFNTLISKGDFGQVSIRKALLTPDQVISITALTRPALSVAQRGRSCTAPARSVRWVSRRSTGTSPARIAPITRSKSA